MRDIELATTPLSAEQVITITDTDLPNPTSALLGQSSSCPTTNSNRSLQRSNYKRFGVIASGKGIRDVSLIADSSNHIIKPNILGGIVSKRALYSLRRLRI